MRSPLSPTVTRNCPASSELTPKSPTSSGATRGTIESIWRLSSLTSASSAFHRRAMFRSVSCTLASTRRSGSSRRSRRSSVSGSRARHRFTNVRLVSFTSSSRTGDGAAIMVPKRLLNACVRARMALPRATRRVRITSTGPAFVLGVATPVDARTDRAICSASRRSDLPSMWRACRLGLLTSTTLAPASVMKRVRVAPKFPVLSTPIATTSPQDRTQPRSAP
jgi:hypothetical protein